MNRKRSLLVAAILAVLLSVPVQSQTFDFATFSWDQADTPDVVTALAPATYDGAIVTAAPSSATSSVVFPTSTAGFLDTLSLGVQLGLNSSGTRAVNLPSGNNGTTARSGMLMSWSGGRTLVNAAGDDLVVYESASNGTTPEGFMIQVHNATTASWSPWYYEPADTFQIYTATEGAHATAYDLSDLGVGATDEIDMIRLVNLTDEDRMVSATGVGEVIPEDNGNTSANLPDPGSLAGFANYGSSTLDPDPLYVGVLRDVGDPARMFTFATFTWDPLYSPDTATGLDPGTYNGAVVTALPSTAPGSVGFPQSPVGFDTSLTIGRLLGLAGSGVRPVNLPSGNDGLTARSGFDLTWSSGLVLPNLPGDDIVVYESASDPNEPDGWIIQVHDLTFDQWSAWYYEPAETHEFYVGSITSGAFAVAIDFDDLGIGPQGQIDVIRIVNMTDEDRMLDVSGAGEVIPEDNGTTSSNFADPGSLANFGSFGATTLDPDPLFVGAFNPPVMFRPLPIPSTGPFGLLALTALLAAVASSVIIRRGR